MYTIKLGVQREIFQNVQVNVNYEAFSNGRAMRRARAISQCQNNVSESFVYQAALKAH